VTKVGFKPVMAIGMACIAAGLVWFAQISVGGSAAIANGIIGSSHDPVVLTEGFQSAFLVGAAFAVVGLIVTLTLIRTSDSKAHVELDSGPTVAAAETPPGPA
jgi:hypothetical protein